MAGEDLRIGDDGRAGLRDLHGLQHASGRARFTEIDGELGEQAVEGVVTGRDASGAFLAEAGHSSGVRLAVTRKGDVEDAQAVLTQTEILGFRGRVGGGDDGREIGRTAAAGESQGGVERKVEIGVGLYAGAPSVDRLVLDGDASGEAHPEIRVTHVRPGFVERRGRRGDVAESFEFTTELLLRCGVEPGDRRGGLRSLVSDAIERGLAAATTDGHVHVAVLRADHRVGDGERLTRGEDFLAGLPAAAFRREVNCVERGEGPVTREERALIGGGELGASAHGGAGRAARTDVDERGLHVERGESVVASTGAPAELAARGAEVDAGRTIPRGAHVPLHVGVVGEDIAVRGDRAIVRIAEASGHADPILAVLIHTGDPAADGLDAGGVAVGVFVFLQKVVFVVTLHRCADLLVVGQLGVVAADHEDRAVAVEDELVWAVFARALERADHGLFGVGAVALGVAQTPDVALALLARAGVKRPVGEEQAVAAEELRVDLGDDGLVGILQRDAPEHAALVAGDEVAFRRDGERDPSALFRLGHEMQELGLEAGLQNEFLGSGHGSGRGTLAALGDRGLTIERLTPGLFAILLDESRGGPGGVSEAGVFPALARLGEGRLPVRAGFSEDGLARGETEGQRGDTAIVTSEHGDRVHAGLEVAADLGVESLRPIVGAAERLAVEPDDAVIIGGGLQQRLGRHFLQFEGGAEPDFLFRDVVLRAPDPGSLRRGDDGTEAKDGQTEQAEGHGEMRGCPQR